MCPPTLPMNPSSSLTTAEKVLKECLSTPEFRDIHLYAFSRRTVFPDGSRTIDHPLPISAIGSILEDTDHFSKCEHAHADSGPMLMRIYSVDIGICGKQGHQSRIYPTASNIR